MSKIKGLDNISKKAFDLVKDVSDEEVNKLVPSMISTAIQADKDILSQIVVEYNENSDKTIVTFPKSVIPLMIQFGGAYYNTTTLLFLYNSSIQNFEVVENDGTRYLNGILLWNDGLKIQFEGNVSSYSVLALQYISSCADKHLASKIINSYYLYHPITQSVTKLYKHSIKCDNGGQYIEIVSKDQELVSESIVLGYRTLVYGSPIFNENIINVKIVSQGGLYVQVRQIKNDFSGIENITSTLTISSDTDTVTEL